MLRSQNIQQIRQSLLSSRNQIMPDRPQFDNQQNQVDFSRLQRTMNAALTQNRCNKQLEEQGPLLCPMVFKPQSNFIIGWQALNILLIYTYFLQIPIIIAFENQRVMPSHERFFQLINIPAIIIFCAGILVKLNTAYYKDGILIIEPSQIRSTYVKKQLVFDLISIFSIIIYETLQLLRTLENQSVKLFVMFFYLKIFELMDIERTLVGSFDLNRRIKSTLKLFLLLMKILLICSIVACSGFFISNYMLKYYPFYDDQGEKCIKNCYWIMSVEWSGKALGLIDDFSVQYVYSLYWASTTMISIGYGDITPKNPVQIGFTIFIQFLSCLLYAYSINQIWQIIQELNSKRDTIKSRLSTINLYMRDKGIGEDLTAKVNAYLTNYYMAKNLRQRDLESQIINQLTPALRRQLFFQSYSVLFSHNFFRMVEPILIKDASQCVKQIGYYQHQNAISPFDCSQAALIYVKGGQFSRTVGNTKARLKTVQTGDVIGYYEFFSIANFKSQMTALSYSLCYRLQFSDWRKKLDSYQTMVEKFYETRDEVILYQNLGLISVFCYFCRSETHTSQSCPQYVLRNLVCSPSLRKRNGTVMYRSNYTRRQLKNTLTERRNQKRKTSLKNQSVTEKRFRGVGSGHLISQFKAMQFEGINSGISANKKSPLRRRGGKFFIYNRQKRQQNLIALERIRREHGQDIWDQNSEQQQQQIKTTQCNMQVLSNYTQFYPSFNPSEYNTKEQKRRFANSSFGF